MKNLAIHRHQCNSDDKAYRLREDWVEEEARADNHSFEAERLHLADLRAHHQPLTSVEIRPTSSPRRLRPAFSWKVNNVIEL